MHWNPGLHGLCCSPVVPPGLSTRKCGANWFSSCYLAACPLCTGCPSPPLLLVLMNVPSLIPWLWDFHTVRFSGHSGYFLFLNLLLSFFWLCEEAKCIYLCLHLGWKSKKNFFLRFYLFILERGKEGERKGEKHQCTVASCVPLVGDLACNPGMCPDWESNR